MQNDITFDIETTSAVLSADLHNAIIIPIREEYEEKLLEVRADGRMTDAAKIAADIDKKKNEILAKMDSKLRAEVEKFPLNWFTGQITAVGFQSEEKEVPIATIFYQDKERFEERDIIVFAWQYLTRCLEANKHPFRLITYSGKNFDVPFFLFRSMLNQVKPTCQLSYRKYNTQSHLDLFEDVFHEKSLDFWRIVFGFSKRTIMSGKDMPRLFAEGNIKEIVDHLNDDLDATTKIANLVSPYFGG